MIGSDYNVALVILFKKQKPASMYIQSTRKYTNNSCILTFPSKLQIRYIIRDVNVKREIEYIKYI